MRRTILRDLAILLISFGVIWGIVSVFPVFPEKVELISMEKEQELGKRYLDVLMLDPSVQPLEDESLDSVIGVIGRRLEKAVENRQYEYHYTLFETEMINAFTLPGGYVVVTTGLIRFCDRPEELAAVIAHEMGHAEMKHVTRRLVRELGMQILSSGDPYVMGEVTKMITSSTFDRHQEKEADRFSREVLERAGIEPRILATLFRKLKAEQDNRLLEKFEIVSTHPNFDSRIRAALGYEPDPGFREKPFEIDWKSVKNHLPANEGK